MSLETVRHYLSRWGQDQAILVMEASTATVELAAEALGAIPARIAKTLSFYGPESAIIVVVAGDAKVDNRRFREHFGLQPKMLSPEDVPAATGHTVGGVCPFALPEGVKVYLDASLRRFHTVFPACGTSHSAIELTLPQLEEYSGSAGWVDVCKAWREEEQN